MKSRFQDIPLLFFALAFGVLLSACAAEKRPDFMASGHKYAGRTLFGPAMGEYEEAIKEDPNNAEAHYLIGALANELGNSNFAARKFREALNIDANHPSAKRALATYHVNRGTTARQQNRLSAARQELEAAVRVDPRSSVAQLELGRAYEADGRVDDAIQAYEASAKADPRSIETQLELGQGYVVTQQYTSAVTAFNAVLDGNPEEAEAYAGLGEAYFHQGQKHEAKQSFDQAIRRYLLTGRRDLAKEVKSKADALLPAGAGARK